MYKRQVETLMRPRTCMAARLLYGVAGMSGYAQRARGGLID
jgi:hypothetical protein